MKNARKRKLRPDHSICGVLCIPFYAVTEFKSIYLKAGRPFVSVLGPRVPSGFDGGGGGDYSPSPTIGSWYEIRSAGVFLPALFPTARRPFSRPSVETERLGRSFHQSGHCLLAVRHSQHITVLRGSEEESSRSRGKYNKATTCAKREVGQRACQLAASLLPNR